MIALPPSAGALHSTCTDSDAGLTIRLVGASGTTGPVGVTDAEAVDWAPLPPGPMARTLNV